MWIGRSWPGDADRTQPITREAATTCRPTARRAGSCTKTSRAYRGGHGAGASTKAIAYARAGGEATASGAHSATIPPSSARATSWPRFFGECSSMLGRGWWAGPRCRVAHWLLPAGAGGSVTRTPWPRYVAAPRGRARSADQHLCDGTRMRCGRPSPRGAEGQCRGDHGPCATCVQQGDGGDSQSKHVGVGRVPRPHKAAPVHTACVPCDLHTDGLGLWWWEGRDRVVSLVQEAPAPKQLSICRHDAQLRQGRHHRANVQVAKAAHTLPPTMHMVFHTCT